MSLEKDFVPYQEAMELKELDFDEPCFGYHDNEGLQFCVYWWNRENKNSLFVEDKTNPKISAPTFSQAFRWFREKYTLYSIISTIMHTYPNLEFYFKIQGLNNGMILDKFNSYEEAELACLRELIKIVKDGK